MTPRKQGQRRAGKTAARSRLRAYNLPMDDATWDALEAQARREERSKAQVLRRALRAYIHDWEPLRGS